MATDERTKDAPLESRLFQEVHSMYADDDPHHDHFFAPPLMIFIRVRIVYVAVIHDIEAKKRLH